MCETQKGWPNTRNCAVSNCRVQTSVRPCGSRSPYVISGAYFGLHPCSADYVKSTRVNKSQCDYGLRLQNEPERILLRLRHYNWSYKANSVHSALHLTKPSQGSSPQAQHYIFQRLLLYLAFGFCWVKLVIALWHPVWSLSRDSISTSMYCVFDLEHSGVWVALWFWADNRYIPTPPSSILVTSQLIASWMLYQFIVSC